VSRPTILDVAERSGVSKSTVSNVIRGGPHVSPEVQRRVLDAVRELGYRPNGLARQLVLRRTSTIGVVVGDLANPFYGELVKLLERRANDVGYTTIASNTDGRPEREAARIEALLEQRVAGIVMLQFSGSGALLDELLADGVPLALVGSTDERVDCAGVDETRGLALAVRHLASLGHRRIAYATSPLVDARTDAARHESFVRACAEERCAEAPLAAATAVAAANDIVAIEQIERLEREGRRVPDDVSVVGFDGIDAAGLARIGLTTVAQPREQLAAAGIRLLLERIEAGPAAPARLVLLDPELVVRSSTRKERTWQ